MIAVYLTQTEIKIKKLKAKDNMSTAMSFVVAGGLLRSENAPIDRASPNTRSDRLSIRGVGSPYLSLFGKPIKTPIQRGRALNGTGALTRTKQYTGKTYKMR
jgi:hypothetical protein